MSLSATIDEKRVRERPKSRQNRVLYYNKLVSLFKEYGFDKTLLDEGEWQLNSNGITIKTASKELRYNFENDSITHRDQKMKVSIVNVSRKTGTLLKDVLKSKLSTVIFASHNCLELYDLGIVITYKDNKWYIEKAGNRYKVHINKEQILASDVKQAKKLLDCGIGAVIDEKRLELQKGGIKYVINNWNPERIDEYISTVDRVARLVNKKMTINDGEIGKLFKKLKQKYGKFYPVVMKSHLRLHEVILHDRMDDRLMRAFLAMPKSELNIPGTWMQLHDEKAEEIEVLGRKYSVVPKALYRLDDDTLVQYHGDRDRCVIYLGKKQLILNWQENDRSYKIILDDRNRYDVDAILKKYRKHLDIEHYHITRWGDYVFESVRGRKGSISVSIYRENDQWNAIIDYPEASVYAKFRRENLEKILEQIEELPHEFFDEVGIDFRG